MSAGPKVCFWRKLFGLKAFSVKSEGSRQPQRGSSPAKEQVESSKPRHAPERKLENWEHGYPVSG